MQIADASDATQLPQPYLGQWNVLLEPLSTSAIGEYLGSGYATFRVPTNGLTVLSGRLPDGQTITSSSFLGPQGQVLLFQMLYGNRGSVGAVIKIQPAAGTTRSSVNSEDSGSEWIRPAKVTATDRLYAEGFHTEFTS